MAGHTSSRRVPACGLHTDPLGFTETMTHVLSQLQISWYQRFSERKSCKRRLGGLPGPHCSFGDERLPVDYFPLGSPYMCLIQKNGPNRLDRGPGKTEVSHVQICLSWSHSTLTVLSSPLPEVPRVPTHPPLNLTFPDTFAGSVYSLLYFAGVM